MKKIIFILFTSILVSISSCMFDLKPTITGDGNVVTETRKIENFQHLETSTGLQVYITFGDELSLKVEADKNLQEVIKTECNNGRLKIFAESNIRRAKEKNIYITVPDLKSIEVSSASSVRSKNLLKTNDIEIEVSSAGELEIQVETKKLAIEVSSSGKTKLSGKAEDIDAVVSSAGELKAFDLISQTCTISVSSAGHASVTAEQKLTAEASSAGSIYYKGDAKDKKIEKSSAGKVEQK
jgi:hypothetical protein